MKTIKLNCSSSEPPIVAQCAAQHNGVALGKRDFARLARDKVKARHSDALVRAVGRSPPAKCVGRAGNSGAQCDALEELGREAEEPLAGGVRQHKRRVRHGHWRRRLAARALGQLDARRQHKARQLVHKRVARQPRWLALQQLDLVRVARVLKVVSVEILKRLIVRRESGRNKTNQIKTKQK